jgi:hypothetical protein
MLLNIGRGNALHQKVRDAKGKAAEGAAFHLQQVQTISMNGERKLSISGFDIIATIGLEFLSVEDK